MDQDLIKRYRFFRAQGGGIVGESARCALSLARAEIRAEELGWTYDLEEEQESYRDVYGEDPEPGVEFYCVVAKDENGDCIGSLGFCSGDRHYFRDVAAQLFWEALGERAKREAKAARDRQVTCPACGHTFEHVTGQAQSPQLALPFSG